MSDDFALLDGWTAGDATAAKQLFERHFAGLFRFFRCKCGSASEIEDLVQDTFAACVAGRERFRRDSSFRTYLFATARNKLLQHYRDRRPSIDLDGIGEARLVDLDPSPSVILVKKHEERALLEALRQLPLDAQIVLELYAWENLTGPEVASVLEITEAAMRSRLHRAKQELRRQLERIATSPDLLESTLANLDGWAKSLRDGA